MELKKTNAARMLDRLTIPYTLHGYQVDEEDLRAVHVAESLGQSVDQVYKTLVLRGDKTGVLVAVIPAVTEVDLKALAKISGNKRVEMVAMKDLLPLTGYIRGGCSPLGMKKNFPTYVDSACSSQPFVYVSAGVRGVQLKIAPADLVKATGAVYGNLCS